MKVHELLLSVALERSLRQTTVVSYERLLGRLGLLDQEAGEVTREAVLEALWAIDSPNTRRAACIAVRAVLGLPIQVPRGVPRRYDLPDEDTLRLALLTSPHEVRGLLMMYGALRVGEACAVTRDAVHGDRLTVARQVLEITRTGYPTIVRLGPTKTNSHPEVVLPLWLAERTSSLRDAGAERTATCDVHAQGGVVASLLRPSIVRESLRRAGRRVGIDLNPHLLRHWCITTLLERGVPLAVVSRHARHSDPAVTLRTYAQHDQGRAIHQAWDRD